MTVNARIREARKALKMKQKDFAKSMCVSNTNLADIENERRKANDRIIKLASMIFGISEDWLKNGEGEMFYKSPDEKITRLVGAFNELPPDFQDFVLLHIEKLLKLRQSEKRGKKGSV